VGAAPRPMDAFDARQERGTREAYERYLRGMDASMRQKVALTAAHLLCEGTVADMGMGSGAGSSALAALYPRLKVVGVDLDPTMVAGAQERYAAANLRFCVGDIAQEVFPPSSLDGILDSSVLHHVTSFGGYAPPRAAAALTRQIAALRDHGTLIVRDFLAPEDREVWLDLPCTDGDGGNDPRTCSSAALLERFAREFRSLHSAPGFPVIREPGAREGWRRYRLSLRHANEFLLRKDYRIDWESEVKEEYAYFTQGEFEDVFGSRGLRVLASTPLRNPWIVKHRLEGRCELRAAGGDLLDWPATNYLIAAERVRPGEGVRFREAGEVPSVGFLRMTHHRNRQTGVVLDLARRPHVTLDVVPFFESGGDLFVVARMSHPRPVLATPAARRASLDQTQAPHYVTEPLIVLQTDRALGETAEEMLAGDAGIPAAHVRAFHAGTTYYPSPGGTQEEVRSVLVEIAPTFVSDDLPNRSGFGSSGRVRAIEVEQVLRAAQVGGLPDARLELSAYELLLGRGRAPGPWLGAELEVGETAGIDRVTTFEALSDRPKRRLFEQAPPSQSPGFLSVCSSRFEELNGTEEVVATGDLQYVLPKTRSACTVACALLARRGGELILGLDDDDLPAAQCFTGNSQLLVAPAWRLPLGVESMRSARAWILERIASEYGLRPGRIFDLGGRYHPSAGLSPEVVYPMAVEILEQTAGGARRLDWVALEAVASARGELLDGHLRLVALRSMHALWDQVAPAGKE